MSPVSFEAASDAVRARLGKRGADHCERVAATAADLASTYGVDVEQARLAGVLHDWDRDRPRDQLAAAALGEGLDVTSADEAVPYLLHARTGAAGIAEAFPGISVDVVQSVARHTVGAPDMTPLDEVIYLADMMEPARDFTGVDDLRSAAGKVPLSELFAMGYQLSLMRLVRRRRPIHPETLDVWNKLVVGEKQ